MKKKFNVKGVCIPTKHYMIDITTRLENLKALVEAEAYFVINRGRQYGKTTTLVALANYLATKYPVISLSFQGLGDVIFETEANFCQTFLDIVKQRLRFCGATQAEQASWESGKVVNLSLLSEHITNLCEHQKFVLIIDDVDQASNHQVFQNFLGMLRNKYQLRNNAQDFTFHSVILAGVYDIKNIKLKPAQAGNSSLTTNENMVDPPWNIAEDFADDMAFSTNDIAGMLTDYEVDQQTGMDVATIAKEIHAYTNGYPFLVCYICQYLDEKLAKNWTKANILVAITAIIEAPQTNALFDDLFKNLRNNFELSDFLYKLLMTGKIYTFSQGNAVIEQGLRCAFISNHNRQLHIHNKIFEIIISDYFISEEQHEGNKFTTSALEHDVIDAGQFDIERFFEKFNAYYQRHYSKESVDFLEREATFCFLCFLQPYLNGKGSYYLETAPNLATGRRLAVVISYGKQQFIIELKVWRGQPYRQDVYHQLADYVKQRGATQGYLLTFDFRKKKETKQAWINAHEIPILEIQV